MGLIANTQPISSMDQYIADVLSGEIVVGALVRAAVERHSQDLKRSDAEEFPYVFDRGSANRAIKAFPILFRHTIGAFAGSPFILAPWQAFIVGSIFGWKCLDGTRKFRRVYCSVGRKSGKSTLSAALAVLFAGFNKEAQAQVFIGATKVEQAKVVFDEATRMCNESPRLVHRSRRKVGRIEFGTSYIKPLGSDRAFSGLNPSVVIFDELHEWKEVHRRFYDTLTTGSAARTQPIRITITTAGDKNSFLWKEEDSHATSVVTRQYDEERYFVFVASIDKGLDPFDEENWPMSMPNIGLMDLTDIQQLAKEAQISPQARHRFLRYHANQEVSSISRALEPEDWDDCEVKELSDWNLADVVAGAMDAGGMNDLAASARVARYPIGFDDDGTPEYRYEVKGRCYMDVDTSRDMQEQPWLAWVDTGQVKMTPSVFGHLRDDLAMDLQLVGGKLVGFDPWNLRQMGEEMQAEGFECVKIPQNRYNLHEPLRLFLDLVQKKRITHDGSWPLLRWAIENLVINSDSNERWMPDRKQSADKIDPIVAVIMALRLASLAPARPKGSLFVS